MTTENNKKGSDMKKAIEDATAQFEGKCKAIEKDLHRSQFVGSEGDAIELSVTVLNKFWIEGYYGDTICVEMRNVGNIFTILSNSKFARNVEIDDDVTIKGIIKGHRTADKKVKMSDFEYHIVEDVNTTTLTRVKELV